MGNRRKAVHERFERAILDGIRDRIADRARAGATEYAKLLADDIWLKGDIASAIRRHFTYQDKRFR